MSWSRDRDLTPAPPNAQPRCLPPNDSNSRARAQIVLLNSHHVGAIDEVAVLGPDAAVGQSVQRVQRGPGDEGVALLILPQVEARTVRLRRFHITDLLSYSVDYFVSDKLRSKGVAFVILPQVEARAVRL